MSVNILVVDDEPDLETLILQKFRKRIRNHEFEFHFASNGIEALRKLDENKHIDIVLTDINMPEMDGLTLLAELAGLGALLKSVVISAYGDMQNIRTAMNRGAFDFLTKPIDFQDLEITIEKTIRELNDLRAGVDARDQLSTMQRELDVAARIQQSILPKDFPPFPDRKELEIFASMVPARQVGGDFYDFFFLDDDFLGFVVGDVAGKGVPAAILMAVTRSLVKATALTGLSPDACVRHVNDLLLNDNRTGLFVTLFYGILDTRSGKVEYCNAGHNLPIHITAGGTHELENQGGLVLGVLENNGYRTSMLELKAGETLFMYTDGVTEAMNPQRELFEVHRLTARLQRSANAPLDVLTRELMDDITAFAQGAEVHDDITTLSLRYLGGR